MEISILRIELALGHTEFSINMPVYLGSPYWNVQPLLFFLKRCCCARKQSNVLDKFKMLLRHSAYRQPSFPLKGWDNCERDQRNDGMLVRELDTMHLSLSLLCAVLRRVRARKMCRVLLSLSEVRHFPSRTCRVQWIKLCNLRTHSPVRLC